MKVTKSQLQQIIKEEVEAVLNEETRMPPNLERYTRMVMGDVGDAEVLQKIQQIEKKLGINFKMELAIEILQDFGIDVDPAAIKTAITKGEQNAAQLQRTQTATQQIPEQGN